MALNINLDITEIYKDTLQPSMKQVGMALEDLTKTARLLTAPLSLGGITNDRFQKWCDRMRNEVKEENMIEAQPNILIPTLCGLAINPDETLLGKMFFNILRNSVDKTKQKFLSPAFPKILEQISKDEAEILTLLKIYQYIDNTYYMIANENGIYEEKCIEVSYNIDKCFFTIYKNHLALLGLLTGTYYQQTEVFFEINGNLILQDSPQGREIINNQQAKNYKNICKYFYRLEFNEFGKVFAEICIDKKCEEYLTKNK